MISQPRIIFLMESTRLGPCLPRLSATRGLLKQNVFAAVQESVRKDVELAFGFLVGRFHIIKRSCLLRSRENMAIAIRACIIIHNMIVESRRDSYDSGMFQATQTSSAAMPVDSTSFDWQDRDSLGLGPAEHVQKWSNTVTARYKQFTSQKAHARLTSSLVQHIWNRYRATEE
jgi:Plant transposon protein